jgi:hypothetical protein
MNKMERTSRPPVDTSSKRMIIGQAAIAMNRGASLGAAVEAKPWQY